jgi:hypothetical protein
MSCSGPKLRGEDARSCVGTRSAFSGGGEICDLGAGSEDSAQVKLLAEAFRNKPQKFGIEGMKESFCVRCV